MTPEQIYRFVNNEPFLNEGSINSVAKTRLVATLILSGVPKDNLKREPGLRHAIIKHRLEKFYKRYKCKNYEVLKQRMANHLIMHLNEIDVQPLPGGYNKC